LSRLFLSFLIPRAYDYGAISKAFREIEIQVNALSEGKPAGSYNAYTAAPTGAAVTYAQGDFLRNSTPTELGSAGSKYVITGWLCVASGAPGTWVESRALTGN
jgi:hypothetical protein